ncbi:MAG: DUF6377 domain-containing protein [Bacteroidales bacterium]|nr:DUF6377 domain-containing protein [Bacteroidales bacterium]
MLRILLTLSLCLGSFVAMAIEVSRSELRSTVERLDEELKQRQHYINQRLARIDSLYQRYIADTTSIARIEALARAYTSFRNDSSLFYYSLAFDRAKELGDEDRTIIYRLHRAMLLPLAGFVGDALEEYKAIDTLLLSPHRREIYYDSGRQMYSYLAAFYPTFPQVRQYFLEQAIECQRRYLEVVSEGTHKYRLNQGEYYFYTGQYAKAEAVLKDLLADLSELDNTYGRAAHIVADISRVMERPYDRIYYLALSAISDVKSATLEVTSLQDLGLQMFEHNEVEAAHRYLYAALNNAVECGASSRMIETAQMMPVIENVHEAELAASHRRTWLGILCMAIALLALTIVLIFLRRQILLDHELQRSLKESNHIKEVYISQFLNLCSIYMDKLNQFCKIANRKISMGKVDDLYKMTRSGKFIENQSKDFYEVFDNAFLHIYPHFVDSVNKLLKPDEQIVLEKPGELNTDLRILAFMRLGIEESTRIAQILNYSVYTIYTYRNRLKNKAIRRDTFEADILAIDSR